MEEDRDGDGDGAGGGGRGGGAPNWGDTQDIMHRLAAPASLHTSVRRVGWDFESWGPLSGSPGEKISTGGCASSHEGYFFHSERLYAGEPGRSQAVMPLSLCTWKKKKQLPGLFRVTHGLRERQRCPVLGGWRIVSERNEENLKLFRKTWFNYQYLSFKGANSAELFVISLLLKLRLGLRLPRLSDQDTNKEAVFFWRLELAFGCWRNFGQWSVVVQRC